MGPRSGRGPVEVPPSGFGATMAALRGAQKPSHGVSVYSVRVNRPWGRVLAALAAALGLTPNSVTVLSALSSAAAVCALVLLPPTPATGVVAAFLLALGFALDSADGQLARLRRTGGPAGEWLDHVVDCSVKLVLHSGVLVAWYVEGVRGPVLLVPLAFQLVTVVTFVAGTLAGLLLPRVGHASGPGSSTRSLLGLLPVDYGVLCWSFLLWGWADGFRGWYLVLLVVHAAYLAALSRHWWRQLTAGGAT